MADRIDIYDAGGNAVVFHCRGSITRIVYAPLFNDYDDGSQMMVRDGEVWKLIENGRVLATIPLGEVHGWGSTKPTIDWKRWNEFIPKKAKQADAEDISMRLKSLLPTIFLIGTLLVLQRAF